MCPNTLSSSRCSEREDWVSNAVKNRWGVVCWVHKGLVEVFYESGVVTQSSQGLLGLHKRRIQGAITQERKRFINSSHERGKYVISLIELQGNTGNTEGSLDAHLSNFPSLMSDLLNFNLNTFWTAIFIFKKLLRIYLKDKSSTFPYKRVAWRGIRYVRCDYFSSD